MNAERMQEPEGTDDLPEEGGTLVDERTDDERTKGTYSDSDMALSDRRCPDGPTKERSSARCRFFSVAFIVAPFAMTGTDEAVERAHQMLVALAAPLPLVLHKRSVSCWPSLACSFYKHLHTFFPLLAPSSTPDRSHPLSTFLPATKPSPHLWPCAFLERCSSTLP